jgi:hypothetical protein
MNPLAPNTLARPVLSALITDMRLLPLLKVLAARWLHLKPPVFTLLTYLYRRAADTGDGVVRQPRKEIAAATRILPRKIRRLLKNLHDYGAIEVISPAEQQTVVRILPEHLYLPPAVVSETPAARAGSSATLANIKQLMFRMTGTRPTPEDVRKLKAAADTDNEGLVKVLDFLSRNRFLCEDFKFLTSGVIHQLLVWERPAEYR